MSVKCLSVYDLSVVGDVPNITMFDSSCYPQSKFHKVSCGNSREVNHMFPANGNSRETTNIHINSNA